MTKQRITRLPDSSVISWNVAISLYVASKGSSAILGYSLLVETASMPPFAASATRAPSVGSPISSPSLSTASDARTIGVRT